MRSALFERALAGNLDNIALRLSLNEGDPCRLMVIDCKNESVLPIQQFLDSFPGCSPLHCLTGQRIVLLMQGRAMIAAQGYYQYIAGHTAGLELNGLPTLPIDYE